MFGEDLRKWRKKRNLTQAQLGTAVGVTGAYIQQLELGKKTNPSIEIIMKLCTTLNIAPFDLDYDFRENELYDYLINKDKVKLNIEENMPNRFDELENSNLDLFKKYLLATFGNNINQFINNENLNDLQKEVNKFIEFALYKIEKEYYSENNEDDD